jgi:serine O-acetyltransferase
MGLIKDTKSDLMRLKTEYGVNPVLGFLTNRGYHALLVYRIAHFLDNYKIPLLPLILTRLIQILYAVDIDYRAKIEGGVVIIHGICTVIGLGVTIKSGTTIYHGVTLGRKKQGLIVPADDGFPTIKNNCLLGAGAKILGPITIGENSVIGPNCVVMEDLPDNYILKFNDIYFIKKSKHAINHLNQSSL